MMTANKEEHLRSMCFYFEAHLDGGHYTTLIDVSPLSWHNVHSMLSRMNRVNTINLHWTHILIGARCSGFIRRVDLVKCVFYL